MNERIRELSFEAQRYALDNTTGPDLASLHELWQEKFAELIVRQCGYYADVFESLGCPVDMDPTETKPSDYIKKHFGVEE